MGACGCPNANILQIIALINLPLKLQSTSTHHPELFIIRMISITIITKTTHRDPIMIVGIDFFSAIRNKNAELPASLACFILERSKHTPISMGASVADDNGVLLSITSKTFRC